MDFTEALEFWQQNQLRMLVLASLANQWFLFVFAPVRQHRIPGLLRFFIWLTYLGSDAVAIYALATLVNSRRCGRGHPAIELMWAPMLLVHLSGQDSITAYNIEDNELWRRQVLSAASQVTAAIYVFFKSFPKSNVTATHLVADPTTIDQVKAIRAHKEEMHAYVRFCAPAVLVLSCGIFLRFLKPWELKKVSVSSLADSGSEEMGEREINSLQEYVGAATQYFDAHRGTRRLREPRGSTDGHYGLISFVADNAWKPYNLCVDLAPPYSVRLCCLKLLVRINPDRAHRLVKSKLSATFHQLYTKESLKPDDHVHRSMGLLPDLTSFQAAQCLWPGVAFQLMAATMLFEINRGTDQDPMDVTITYALLLSAVVMKLMFQYNMHRTWPDHAAQYNLMGYVARSKKHSCLMKVVAWLGFKDLVDQLWTMKPCKGASSQEITALVHGHVTRGWTEGHIAGADTFRTFNDYRGQWTLNREVGVGRRITSIVLMSVSRPFDESVLIWHIATDFCFDLLQDPEDASPSSAAARRCREMSNYMAYLLFVKPDMLMPGARRNLFRDACGGLMDVLDEDPRHTLERDGDNIHGSGIGVVRDAWSIAEDLMDSYMDDEEKMWTVIQGVWVEMLCFSASRCRGYLHAKSLGTGGEYLSYVWLVLLYMGMETMAEKMQRTELYKGPTAAGSPFSGQNV